jgi:hypothetical protein
VAFTTPRQETDRPKTIGYCSAALQTCLEILKIDLRLPVHPPVTVEKYGPKFWRTKSRQVYRWMAPQHEADVPWVQFLGYQIRHDGVLRSAKNSLERHRERLRAETDRVLNVPGRPHWKFRKFLNRVARRLVNLSIGRNGARRPWPARCWVDGFQLLQGRLQFAGPLNPYFPNKLHKLELVTYNKAA